MPDHAIPDAADFPLRARLDSADRTRELGARLADRLAGGEIVLLWGPLGGGKTCLVQGLCERLGVAEEVVSPTFTLANRYAGRLVVHHLDFYRLGPEDDLTDVGVEDVLDEVSAGGAVLLAEWPDPLLPLVPERCELLVVPGEGADERLWCLRGTPAVPDGWAEALAAAGRAGPEGGEPPC